MKKFLVAGVLLSVFLSGCNLLGGSGGSSGGSYGGNTKKAKSSKYVDVPPYGMVLVPGGSFLAGASDEDVFTTLTSTPKPITVDPFWMDETEVTNSEYRNFTNYVKEYNLRKALGYLIEDDGKGNTYDPPLIDWRKRINPRSPEFAEALASMNYSPEESLMGKKEVDVRKMMYEWQWVDYQQAARVRWNADENKYDGTILNSDGEEVEVQSRADFIRKDNVNVYPDTLCWIRDYTYMYNEPFVSNYFWHPAYNEYPVVGVTWKQAEAYARWKAEVEHRPKNQLPMEYRLPTETEWEYAARGGISAQLYPWGGPYTTDQKGCYLANFKPQRGKHGMDGGVRTTPVGSYEPNDYGLFDMAGNVAEWTANSYNENSYSFYEDLSPTLTYNARKDDPQILKRKVIRGGSWKDISYYIQCGTRTYEYQDSAKCYIGFRCVRQYVGTSAK